MVSSMLLLTAASCKTRPAKTGTPSALPGTAEKKSSPDSAIVYQTEGLVIRRLSHHVYQHTSFLNTNSFGRVDCNGMIVAVGNDALVFDTPADEKSSEELIAFLQKELRCRIKTVVPTHFHEDCVGGLESFYKHGVPAMASAKTLDLLEKAGRKFSKPLVPFSDSLALMVGGKDLRVLYFGEGHTKDNVVAYFPEEAVLFGGCLIKSVGAAKGNLADANVQAWPATVRKLKDRLPLTNIVIPGHGQWGGRELLDYTIELFE